MINVIGIKSLKTNYIWIIHDNLNQCIIVDPGESINTLKILKKLKFSLIAILLTHNHSDHTHGIYTLKQRFPNIIIYGPIDTKQHGTNIIVSQGDELLLLNNKIKIFHLPGHTLNHIGFYFYEKNLLFSGDTIFSAGCGYVQTGLIKNMYESFLKIKNLSKNTLIYSGHEYTLENINFVISILPKNKSIINYYRKVIQLNKQKKNITPTTLSLELKINPFLRCDSLELKKALNLNEPNQKEWKIFKELRRRKDLYNNSNKFNF